MPNKRMIAAALAALIACGAISLRAQAKHPEAGDGETRLYPRFAYPDGSFNCAPKCGMLGPCC